jgi:hypothetical protein
MSVAQKRMTWPPLPPGLPARKIEVRLTRDVPTFSGDIKAGTVLQVISLTAMTGNRGISGLPVESVEFLHERESPPVNKADPPPPIVEPAAPTMDDFDM